MGKKRDKRSQVQGSTFSAASDRRSGQFDRKRDYSVAESHTRVRGRDKIEDPKSSQKMLVLPHSCQIPCSVFVGMWKRSVFPYKTFTK